MKPSRLEIYKGQLSRNRGHSKRGHKGKYPTVRIKDRSCYRCFLISLIEREEMRMSGGLQ